jgi:hypothetical protein
MAILATSKVLTLDYWKPAYQLKIGDYLFDKEGKIVQIKLIQEYRADNCYSVNFNDYLSVSGDINLGFPVETPKYRKRTYQYMGVQKFRRPLMAFKLDKLQDIPLKTKTNRLLYSVPTTKPIELPHQDLPVPPFIFGFWFFSRKSTGCVSAARGHHEEIAAQFKDFGYKIKTGRTLNTGEKEFKIFPSIESQLIPNVPNKIPNNYLLGSVEQRIALLKGILVAKNRQYSPKKDWFRFTDPHYGIVLAIQSLVESIGCKSKLVHDESMQNYTLFFKSRIKLISNQVSPPIRVHQSRRYITSVTPIQPQSCVHIETTGSDNTILVGEGFISCL